MKNKLLTLLTISILTMCGACSNDEEVLNTSSTREIQGFTMTGTLSNDNPTDTVTVNGKVITLSLSDVCSSDSDIQTRGVGDSTEPKPKPGELGPFYSQGTPKALSGSEYKNRKLMISGMTGVVTGVYFGDVWETRNSIKLPENAYGARVAFPNPSGCKDYTNLSRGVNWNLTTIQNDQIMITWWFYTFVLNYNTLGQQIYEVVPIDGAKVKVPYFYMMP